MMNTTYEENILKNTEMAAKQWNEFVSQCEDSSSFKKQFHLRPTSSGVTIVSTIEERAMRGKKIGKTVVKKWLEELYTLMMSAKTQEEKLQVLEQLNFADRKKSHDKIKEEFYQAKMIAEMSNNQSLKDILKVEQLIFIASEFILHDKKDTSDRERIDIIAFDGVNRLFFFELKTPDNIKDNPVQQLKRYLNTYGKHKKNKMLKVLKKYPINSVNQENIIIEGYAVEGYGEEVKLFEIVDSECKVGRIVF